MAEFPAAAAAEDGPPPPSSMSLATADPAALALGASRTEVEEAGEGAGAARPEAEEGEEPRRQEEGGAVRWTEADADDEATELTEFWNVLDKFVLLCVFLQ